MKARDLASNNDGVRRQLKMLLVDLFFSRQKKGKQLNVQMRLRVKAKKCDRPVLKQTFSDTSAKMLRDYF